MTGRLADAETAYRSLLDRDHDPDAEGPARICLGHALLAGGRPHDALQELERAGESLALSGAERASALGWASIARTWLGDLDGSAAVAEQARSVAAAAGDHITTSIAGNSSALVSLLRGQFGKALEIIDDAVRLADQSPGRQGYRFPLHVFRGAILVELDELEEARSAFDADRRISEELGVRWHLPAYLNARGAERFIAGGWDDAIAELETSAGLAEETGSTYTLAYALALLSLISLHRNDLRRAGEAASAAVGQLETGARARAQWALWARALVLEADGKIADAHAALAGCWDRCAQLGLTLEYGMLGPDLVRLAVARGDRERAREVAAAVAELADENPEVSSLAGAALRCRGLAEDDAEILHAAAAAYAQGPRQLELALASEDAGTAFARQGMTGQARPPGSGDRDLRPARRRPRPRPRRGSAACGRHPPRPPRNAGPATDRLVQPHPDRAHRSALYQAHRSANATLPLRVMSLSPLSWFSRAGRADRCTGPTAGWAGGRRRCAGARR